MRTSAGSGKRLKRIISGGQTGVDRAALDAGLNLGLEVAGYVPKGRLAEDGPVPETYPSLIETASSDPAERTELNILSSDATLLISRGSLKGGSRLAEQTAQNSLKQHLHIDLKLEVDPKRVRSWLIEHEVQVLNIAGPRESEDPGIYEEALAFLRSVLQ